MLKAKSYLFAFIKSDTWRLLAKTEVLCIDYGNICIVWRLSPVVDSEFIPTF